MNITVNEKILKKYNLTLEEFLVLYLCSKEIDIESTIHHLIDMGIVNRDLYNNVSAVVSNNTKELIASIIIDSDKTIIDKDEEFDNLASKMRELYPKGKKPGTTYYWQDSIPIISKKLKTLVAKFKVNLVEEEVLEATQRYINSFNGDYKYMQLLRYFILKTNKDSGETRSELLSYLENTDEDDERDWTTSLV